MDNKQALQIIETGLNQATTKGAFNLVEVSQILTALSFLKQQAEKK